MVNIRFIKILSIIHTGYQSRLYEYSLCKRNAADPSGLRWSKA
jgi:hypothetical protein